jgi:uncharacterized protein YjeT (DUF2065 family)
MPDVPSPQVSPRQVAVLEGLLRAGFKFVTFERFARYPAVERDGFVALLDLAGERVRRFGVAGYHLGEGIGVLLERGSGKFFVWKDQSVAATPELLGTYTEFNQELDRLLIKTPPQ